MKKWGLGIVCALSISSASLAAVNDHQADQIFIPFTKRDAALAAIAACALQATWHFVGAPRERTLIEDFAVIKVQVMLLAAFLHVLTHFLPESHLKELMQRIFFYLAAYCGCMVALTCWDKRLGGHMPYEAAMILVVAGILIFSHLKNLSGMLRKR
jgi:hypothetical protein